MIFFYAFAEDKLPKSYFIIHPHYLQLLHFHEGLKIMQFQKNIN